MLPSSSVALLPPNENNFVPLQIEIKHKKRGGGRKSYFLCSEVNNIIFQWIKPIMRVWCKEKMIVLKD